jgi:hypothetical protein
MRARRWKDAKAIGGKLVGKRVSTHLSGVVNLDQDLVIVQLGHVDLFDGTFVLRRQHTHLLLQQDKGTHSFILSKGSHSLGHRNRHFVLSDG